MSDNTKFDENKWSRMAASDRRVAKALEYFKSEPYHLRVIREQKERKANAENWRHD